MRSFIAIELPETVTAALATLVERLRASGARLGWVKPDAMHLTLRFFGDVDPEPLERLQGLLDDGWADTAPFDLAVRGLGAFPNFRRPSVLWAGIDPAEGLLAQAQATAEHAARAIGLPAENRAFHPHLTLARVKDPAEAARVLPAWEREQGFDAGIFRATGAVLFSSELTPRGPVHTKLREYPFR